MAEKSIKKNYIFNLFYQLLLLITPFITTPYLSRVLGADGIGLYSYSNSIVTYFVLLATLGTTTFAQRKISYVSDSKEDRSRAFWEMFIFRLITSLVTLVAYIIIFTVILKENTLIYIILSLNILNIVFDVSWFLQGLEEFGKTVIINIFFKVLSVVLIFLFVKTADDLKIYILIMAGFLILGNMTMWLYLPKYLCKVNNIKPFKDIKGILQLFIPTVAIQVYTVLDKSMIGWFTEGNFENGYYEQAEKIVKMALTVVTSLGTVMIPRIAKKYTEKDNEAIKVYMYRSYRFVWLMAVPMFFGLIAISNIFVPIFFGDGYEKCCTLIPIFSALLFFIGFSNVTGLQFLVPTSKQNVLTLTVVIGAVINLILNLILIPKFYSIGACISTVIAEGVIMVAGFVYIKKTKQFSLLPILTCCWKYLIAGGAMFGILMLLKMLIPMTVWGLIILVASGIVIYFVFLLILRDRFLIDIISKALVTFKIKKQPQSIQNNSNEEGKNEEL